MQSPGLTPPVDIPVKPLEQPAAPHPRWQLPPIPPARPIELAVLIAIVALADLSIYGGAGGLGIAALLVGIPALLLAAAGVRCVSPRGAVIAALVVLVAMRCAWQSSAGAVLIGAVLLLAFAVAIRTARTYVPELAVAFFGSVFGSVRELGAFAVAGGCYARRLPVARVPWTALVVPLGLVAVFGGVFAAANPVVQRLVIDALAHLPSSTWMPEPLHFVFWAVCALGAAGLLRPVVRNLAGLEAKLGPGHALEGGDQVATALHVSVMRNGFLALNVLFVAYNALDAVYLWAGRAPEGVSHTEYAHSGAAWLTVALVLSTLVLGALFRGAITHDPAAKLARVLAYVWAGQNLVLAAGTFRRITMYVSYSGLTELRIVGILGTSLATIGLVIVVVKLARRRTMLWVLRRQLDAFVLAGCVFIVMPTGWLTMRYNVARVSAAQYRPLLHLFQQRITAEAVPEMLPLLDHEDATVREGVAVILREQQARLRAEATAAAWWTQWEGARARALRALDRAEPRIRARLPELGGQAPALAKLRGVAYGINEEDEREGDDAPFDWNVRRYPVRE